MNKKYYEYLSDRRYFAFPPALGKLVGKPLLFALNNGWAKYYQKDGKHMFKEDPKEF